MRTFIPAALLLSLLPIAACQRPETEQQDQPANIVKVLPNIPLPPGAQPLTSEAGREAAQILVLSTARPDSIVNYYRVLFTKEPWRLINESNASGVTSFYVEQDGPSLWVTVQQNGDSGSMVTIAGAEADSAARAKSAPVRPAS